MGILETLGFKRRNHVGITISANNFIELVCIDKTTKSVIKYASNNIKYNSSIREIVDYEEFSDVITTLFDDVGLDPRTCSVTLSLPNVQFGITPFDASTGIQYNIENIQADVEDLYIFKRNEPILSHSLLDSGITKGQKNIVYSAMQAKVIARIMEIFDKIGTEIVRIDTSYSSIFKAIKFCDRFNKFMGPEEKTLLLLVTFNSCAAFYFVGGVIADVMEEPLAVRSFSSDEVYSAISKLATNSILKNSPQSLVIISEADEVNAQVLSQLLEFKGNVDTLNKSIHNNEQFIEVIGIGSDNIDSNMVAYMTIEAVGAAVSDYDEYPLNINFIPQERIQNDLIAVGEYEVPFKIFLGVVLVSAVITAYIAGMGINTLISAFINIKSRSSEGVQNEINIFKTNVEQNVSSSKIDILPIMTTIVNRNKDILDTYISLSSDIPETIYIKRFITQSDGGIGILGEAKTSESVGAFVNNLRSKNTGLMLQKLSYNDTSSTNSKIADGYTFEIKTEGSNINLNEDVFKQNANVIQNGINGLKNTFSTNPSDSQNAPPEPMVW